MPIWKNFLSGKNKEAALEKLLSGGYLRAVFRPYYINDEKIGHYFEQEYGGLVELVNTHGRQIASEIGLNVKSANLIALVADLLVEAKMNVGGTWHYTTRRELSTVLRFVLLRRYWLDQKRLHPITSVGKEVLSRPHTLISYKGKYRLATSVQELVPPLTQEQILPIKKQYEFEVNAEREGHLLFLLEDLPVRAVSIISERFITHVGFRYLMHFSSIESNTLFIGAIIGFKQDVLFLDPIAIGEDVFD